MGICLSVSEKKRWVATKDINQVMIQLQNVINTPVECLQLLQTCPSLKAVIPDFDWSSPSHEQCEIESFEYYYNFGVRSSQLLQLFTNQDYASIHMIINRMLINMTELCLCFEKSSEFAKYLIDHIDVIPYTTMFDSYSSPIPSTILKLLNYNYVLEKLADRCLVLDDVISFFQVMKHYLKLIPNGHYSQSDRYIENALLFGQICPPPKFLLSLLDNGYRLFLEGSSSSKMKFENPRYQFIWDWYYNHPENIILDDKRWGINLAVAVIYYSRYKDFDLVKFANYAFENNNTYITQTLHLLIFGRTQSFDIIIRNQDVLINSVKSSILYNHLFEYYYDTILFSGFVKNINVSALFNHMCQFASEYDPSLLILCEILSKMLKSGQITDCNQYLNNLRSACLNNRFIQLKMFYDYGLFTHDDWLSVYRNYSNIQRQIENLMELDSPMFRENRQKYGEISHNSLHLSVAPPPYN